MIYLIDDKKMRQESFGWDSLKLSTFEDVLTVIYNGDDLKTKKDLIFNGENVILFHDSFFDNPINKHEKQVDLIKQQLNDYSTKSKTLVVFFSGSIGNRALSGLTLYCPVKLLYENLATFLYQYRENKNEVTPEHIAYGKNHRYEQLILLKNQIWESLYFQRNHKIVSPNDKLLDGLESLSKILNHTFTHTNTTVGYLKQQIQSFVIDGSNK